MSIQELDDMLLLPVFQESLFLLCSFLLLSNSLLFMTLLCSVLYCFSTCSYILLVISDMKFLFLELVETLFKSFWESLREVPSEPMHTLKSEEGT